MASSDLEEIKTRLNIVDVLGEYIRLEKAGSNYRALCPFHNEKSPSFMVSEEKQFWKCFGCQKGGDIFTFVMEIEGLEFRDALKQLAEKAGVKLQGYDPKKAEVKNRTMEILELATKWYEHQLWNGPGKTKVLNYLRERGIKDGTIKEFRLGYAPKGWRNILEFLTKRGFSISEIEKTGLLVKKENSSDHYDRFRERIMFPIGDYSGKVVGYSARVTPGQDEKQAKYVNTPETEVYHKSQILYGLDKARSDIKGQDFVLLVEGNMDVIAASQAGIKNVVAVSGTALTPDQIKIIKRYTPKIRMFFDMDDAGHIATKKSMKMCLSNDMQVEIVTLPSGKDAADMARENPLELKKAVDNSQNAMEYLLEDSLKKFNKDKVADKRKISEIMADMLGSVVNSVEKSHWIKVIAEKLDTTETALTDMLKKANLKNRIKESDPAVSQSESDFLAIRKIDVLIDELTGLALVSPDVWKKLAEDAENRNLGPKDSLLNFLIEKGHELNFDFDQLLNHIDKEAQREKIERLYLQKKYRMGLNNVPEEIDLASALDEAGSAVIQIRKEGKKEKLEKIIKDLRMAEEKNDQVAKKFLQIECKKILDELSNLS